MIPKALLKEANNSRLKDPTQFVETAIFGYLDRSEAGDTCGPEVSAGCSTSSDLAAAEADLRRASCFKAVDNPRGKSISFLGLLVLQLEPRRPEGKENKHTKQGSC